MRSGLVILIPRLSARSAAPRFFLGFLKVLGHFAHDLGRGLVLAQRDEAGVAQDAIVGDFGEGDFGDELGLDPVRPLAVGARDLERGLVGLERRHPLHQLLDQPGVEAGPNLAE